MVKRESYALASNLGRVALQVTSYLTLAKIISKPYIEVSQSSRPDGQSSITSRDSAGHVKQVDLRLPERPVEPDPSDCCGSGCTPCVFDIYEVDLKR